MTDIDELLRQAGTTWRPPEAPPIDLRPVLARQGRTRGAAAVAVVVVLIAGVVLWSVRPDPGIPAAPLETPATAPTSSPPATTPPTASTGPAADLAEITQLARSDALGNARGNTPVTGQAVRTSLAKANAGLGFEPPAEDGPVWVIQLRGVFVCDGCSRPQGADSPTGSVIQRVWDEKTPVNGSWGLVNHPLDLTSLGEVVDLDLGEVPVTPFAVTDPQLAGLAKVVRYLTTELPHAEPWSGEAVATTLGTAQQQLFHHTPTPPPPQEVWFIQVQGEFTCPDCTALGKVRSGNGSVLTLVVDRQNGEPLLRVIADQTTDLTGFGEELLRLPTRELTTAASWQPAIATYPRSSEGGAAAFVGRLLLVGGCLVVEADQGALYLPVLPTPTASWSPLDRTLSIGRDVLQIGDRVSWGGGYSTAPMEGWVVPESCAGLTQEYFRVNSA